MRVKIARLLYLVGPSGAGKDSLINLLKADPIANEGIYFVKRLVDRAIHESSPFDLYMASIDFAWSLQRNELAMYWKANDHQYGISHTELAKASLYPISVINGSRAYAQELKLQFPTVEIVHITASESIIKERLKLRNRENELQIEERLQRSRAIEDLSQLLSLEIHNDSNLSVAFEKLINYIKNPS